MDMAFTYAPAVQRAVAVLVVASHGQPALDGAVLGGDDCQAPERHPVKVQGLVVFWTSLADSQLEEPLPCVRRAHFCSGDQPRAVPHLLGARLQQLKLLESKIGDRIDTHTSNWRGIR
jgi:hypothetical protein